MKNFNINKTKLFTSSSSSSSSWCSSKCTILLPFTLALVLPSCSCSASPFNDNVSGFEWPCKRLPRCDCFLALWRKMSGFVNNITGMHKTATITKTICTWTWPGYSRLHGSIEPSLLSALSFKKNMFMSSIKRLGPQAPAWSSSEPANFIHFMNIMMHK